MKKNFFQRAKHRMAIWCLWCLGSVFFSSPVWAVEASFSPAFMTIGHWDAAKEVRVDVNVWYPTRSKPSRVSYGPWRFNVVRFGKAAEGLFPLIILSHDSAASRFSYHESASLLASLGFVVMAPDHKNDNLQRMTQNFSWSQLQDRMHEVQTVLRMAATHKDIRAMVDMQRVGLYGFGTGATTMLLLGGAMLDAKGWDNYCVQVPQSTAYCNAWAQGHVEKMLTTLPAFGQSFAEQGIKAVVAVSPKYDFLLTSRALNSVALPLLVLETEKDTSKKVWDQNTAKELFPAQTEFYVVDEVAGRDLMSACPPELRRDLPDLCGTATPAQREVAHEVMHEHVVHFFLEHLGQRADF